jgi:hypothetical protein
MSSLSINKLEQLLGIRGFVPKRYFVIHNVCAFVEVVDMKNASTFILSIPSKYKFKLKDANGIYSIKYIDIESDSCIAEDYGGELGQSELEDKYLEIELTNKLLRKRDEKNENITSALEDGYKRPISLKDLSREDKNDIKDIVRQLRRLKFCVQNISYKVGICYLNYLCVIDKDQKIECFHIKHFPRLLMRRLFISVDLRLFYENMDIRLTQDITDIQNGISKVFDKNQESHEKTLFRILEEQKKIEGYSQNIFNKKREYAQYINEFVNLLNHLNLSEKALIEKIKSLDKNTNGRVETNVNILYQKNKLQNELTNLNNTRKNVTKNITELRAKHEDVLLKVDKVMFDNLVMLNAIIKSLELLKVYSE